MGYSTADIRNLCLAGQAGAGKTTLTEALLHAGGQTNSPGSIEQGDTIADHSPAERELGHSLDPALCHLDHNSIHVNLIDTPGLPDFHGRALAMLPAVETAVVVINAQNGIEAVTEEVMAAAAERHLCRMIVVNRIDQDDADLEGLLTTLQAHFGDEVLPLNLPSADRSAVVDCFFQPDGAATLFSSVEEAHTRIVDQVVEVDEALMEVYLEQGSELSPEQLHAPFEQALREGHLVPVCFTSARTGAGITELLDVVERLAPNPTEGNPPEFLRGEGQDAQPVTVKPDAEGHAIGHVFKISVDPFKGRLACFRLHQGRVRQGGQLFVGDARKPIKVAHLLKVQGAEHVEVGEGVPGDILALPRADDVFLDAVLHDSHDEDHYHLRPLTLPQPVYGLAVAPVNDNDAQKVSDALAIITAEDPSLQVDHVASLNETVLRGMGELHLKVAIERMAEQFHAAVDTHLPSIAYRETITAPAEGHHRHKKQTGGAGQFGEVSLRIEPLPRGAGFEFVDKVVGGVIPGQFIPAVEKGVREVLQHGAVAGYPMQDVRVTVHDGKHHSVDSKEIAFATAGRKAFMAAVQEARPIILEPVVDVSVRAPAQAMGDITGDLAGMRGMVSGSEVLADGHVLIKGQVPLAEMQTWHNKLRAMTGGEGSFTMAFSHYAQVPGNVQKELEAGWTGGGGGD